MPNQVHIWHTEFFYLDYKIAVTPAHLIPYAQMHMFCWTLVMMTVSEARMTQEFVF